MKFPKVITRRKGGSGDVPVIGTDNAPTETTEKTGDTAPTFSTRMHNAHGFPVHNIVVAYVGPESAGAADVDAYVWVEDLNAWIKLLDGGSITNGGFLEIPVFSLAEVPGANSAGGIEVYFVFDVDTPPDGTYKFAVGASVSN